MQTLYLDGRNYHTAEELHVALQLLLDLPPYYGRNTDALYDVLSERHSMPTLWLKHAGSDEVAITLAKVERVWEDLGGTFVRL